MESLPYKFLLGLLPEPDVLHAVSCIKIAINSVFVFFLTQAQISSASAGFTVVVTTAFCSCHMARWTDRQHNTPYTVDIPNGHFTANIDILNLSLFSSLCIITEPHFSHVCLLKTFFYYDLAEECLFYSCPLGGALNLMKELWSRRYAWFWTSCLFFAWRHI